MSIAATKILLGFSKVLQYKEIYECLRIGTLIAWMFHMRNNQEGGVMMSKILMAAFSVLIVSSACYDKQQISWSRSGEFEWRHGPRTVFVKHLGEIGFADNDEDVLRVSTGGYLFIQESALLDSRSMEFTRQPDGSVGRRFVVNGEETAVDRDAREWLARMLPEILRRTGINASERATRILDRQGFEALFAEVRLMPRDTDRVRYLQEAIESGGLTEDQKLRIVHDVATTFFMPDSKKSAVLSDWAHKYSEVELLAGLLKAGETIGADSIKARFVLSLIELHCGSAEKMGMILNSVKGIGSDSHKEKVLGVATDCLSQDDHFREAFFDSLNSILSDSHKSSVLRRVVEKSAVTPVSSSVARSAELGKQLGANETVASARVNGTHDVYIEDPGVSKEFYGAVDRIGSNSIRASVLLAVVRQSALGKTTLLRVIESAECLLNDSIKADVLTQIAHVASDDAEVSMRIRQAAETIGSSHLFRTVLSQLEANSSR